jgi:hypothetical protein
MSSCNAKVKKTPPKWTLPRLPWHMVFGVKYGTRTHWWYISNYLIKNITNNLQQSWNWPCILNLTFTHELYPLYSMKQRLEWTYVNHANKRERFLCIFHKSVREFYFYKILHLLFRCNIPSFFEEGCSCI